MNSGIAESDILKERAAVDETLADKEVEFVQRHRSGYADLMSDTRNTIDGVRIIELGKAFDDGVGTKETAVAEGDLFVSDNLIQHAVKEERRRRRRSPFECAAGMAISPVLSPKKDS